MYQILGIIAIIVLLISGCMSEPNVNKRTYEENTDRQGSDYTHFKLNTADAGLCQKKCDESIRCVAWTYVKPHTIQGPKPVCWLKDRIPNSTSNGNCISGIK